MAGSGGLQKVDPANFRPSIALVSCNDQWAQGPVSFH